MTGGSGMVSSLCLPCRSRHTIRMMALPDRLLASPLRSDFFLQDVKNFSATQDFGVK